MTVIRHRDCGTKGIMVKRKVTNWLGNRITKQESRGVIRVSVNTREKEELGGWRFFTAPFVTLKRH